MLGGVLRKNDPCSIFILLKTFVKMDKKLRTFANVFSNLNEREKKPFLVKKQPFAKVYFCERFCEENNID
ncbi:hypothetical protein AC623_20595 [Bacillus sp. FJAT-27231]|nr:hypothetical protein AC623_20595 [Bacillus sp. FJAT-27231]